MDIKQLSVRVTKKLHIKYFTHALRMGDTLTDWVKTALENQYQNDKQKKK